MAKVHNPLFSLSAGGSVATLTYCHGQDLASETHIARTKPRAPKGARSVPQQACNSRFSNASTAFDLLDQTERAWWESHGETAYKFGRAWFIAEYIIQRSTPPAIPQRPVPRWTRP